MSDNRPPVYYEDDVLIIRASAIGSSCLWELVAAGQGYAMADAPANIQRAWEEGHRLEPIINNMLEQEGYVITGSQEEGHLDITDKLRIRYHPDGFTRLPSTGELVILEDKTMSNDSWQRAARGSVGDIFVEYNWQISVMMWANCVDRFSANPGDWFMPALWVAYNKGNSDGSECLDEGRLLYQTVLLPPVSYEDIKNKALQIKELVDGPDILESTLQCNPEHFPCRYLHIRPEPEPVTTQTIDGKKAKTVKRIEPEQEDEVDFLIRDYVKHKGMAEEAKEKQEEAKALLIEMAEGNDFIETSQWRVPVIEGTGNASYDWASMPEELKKELAKYRKPGVKYKYLKGVKRLD